MNIRADQLTQLVAAIFACAGSSTGEAETIARHLVASNLVGHDSHGVIRVSRYIRDLEEDQVRSNQRFGRPYPGRDRSVGGLSAPPSHSSPNNPSHVFVILVD